MSMFPRRALLIFSVALSANCVTGELRERHAKLHTPLPNLTSDVKVDRMRICADNHKRIIGQSRPVVQLRVMAPQKSYVRMSNCCDELWTLMTPLWAVP